MPKIRNIIIFVTILVVLVLVYVFFVKKPSTGTEGSLVSSSPASDILLPDMNDFVPNIGAMDNTSKVAKDFLSLLLNVNTIKLNDAIFASPAFINLRDSSIILVPDGTEGRPNPFAQFGSDIVSVEQPAPPVSPPTTCELPKVLDLKTNTCADQAVCKVPKVLNPSTNTCVTKATCKLPKVLDSFTNTCIDPPPN